MKSTNSDKIFWPTEGYTKGETIAYYKKVSPFILPYLRDRPLVLHRHPDGITKKGFYQKDAGRERLPPFVNTVPVKARSTGKVVRYAVCDNPQALRWLANFGCIGVHSWGSRRRRLRKPDYFVLDLDPSPENTFDQVVEVARAAHALLNELGLKNYCKTSGKTGMHILVPLGGRYTYEEVRAFSRLFVEALHRRMPQLTTIRQRIVQRRGGIYLDYMRNSFGATCAAPYSLRAYPGATVSTPLEWKEVKKGLRPARFTIKTIFPRLKKKGDLLKGLLGRGADLRRAAARLEAEAGRY